MRLGIVLPSWIYNDERRRLATDAFISLARCETLQDETTLLLLVKSGTATEYTPFLEGLNQKFRLIVKTDEGLDGTEQTLAYGTTFLFENYGVDYVTWMGDDSLFHPLWLWKLESLIQAHPNAICWSVYRSAFEFVHRTIKVANEYVRVRSICGHGFTVSKKEWQDWGINWKDGKWEAEYGDTLDLVHFSQRKGERWVTRKSYVEHTGKVGVHCTASVPEHARDFQEK